MPGRGGVKKGGRRTTTIQLTVETRDILKSLGRKGETYEEIIRRLLVKAGVIPEKKFDFYKEMLKADAKREQLARQAIDAILDEIGKSRERLNEGDIPHRFDAESMRQARLKAFHLYYTGRFPSQETTERKEAEKRETGGGA